MICNYGKSNGDHWAQLDAGLDHIQNTPSNCDDVTRGMYGSVSALWGQGRV